MTSTLPNKISVADYVAHFLDERQIRNVFTISGGYSMVLNDSINKNKNMRTLFQHHEAACGYAALGFSKCTAHPSVVLTTAGVGAINPLASCLVAFQDSTPVMYISGQVKTAETVRKMNRYLTDRPPVRHYSGADCDIVAMVEPITKYAIELENAHDIVQVMNAAYTKMTTGRSGPVWISIPLDLQGALIDAPPAAAAAQPPSLTTNIIPFCDFERKFHTDQDPIYENIRKILAQSKRPLIIAGGGIKIAKCEREFSIFIQKNNIPVVCSIHGTGLVESASALAIGKVGIIGDRCGNFAIQNCDVLLCLGCRMSQAVIGYKPEWFAREAKIIYVDNDPAELAKKNLNYTVKLHADLKTFFAVFYNTDRVYVPLVPAGQKSEWSVKCTHWKNKWANEMPPNYLCDNDPENAGINPYFTIRAFFEIAPANKNIVVSSGTIITIVWHLVRVLRGDNFVISSQGDMGFELPAAIGAHLADPTKMTIPILGEGSLQFNLQELQTIVYNNFPIKILLINNGCHGSTVVTQTKFFGAASLHGVNPKTGISFPDTEKLAFAYGIKYLGVRKVEDVTRMLNEFLFADPAAPVICEVFSSLQSRFPRLNARKNEDGTFSNRPFEDMEPFMSREELAEEMMVALV